MADSGSTSDSQELAQAFESLFDLSSLPMLICDGRLVVRANPAAAGLLGIPSAGDMVGRAILDFVHADSQTSMAERLADASGKRTRVQPQIETYVREDGVALNGETIVAPVPWRQGAAVAVTVVDIADRRNAQKATLEAEHRYRSLFDISPDPVVVHDGDSVILANHSAQEFFGLKVQDMRGRSVLGYVHPDQRDRVVARIRTMLESGSRLPRFELTLILDDGRAVEAESSSAPFMLESRRVIMTVFRDVSERKRAERALRESEQRFRAIVEAAPLGMHLYELEGDVLRFTGANPAADRILGVDNSQFIGLPIEEAFPGLMDTEVPRRYGRIARDGGVWSTDQIDYAEGEIRGAFEVHAFRTVGTSMVAMFSDITDRLRSQAELQRLKNDLESAVSIQGVELERAQRDLDAVTTIASKTVEQRDPYTAGHQRRVGQLAVAIAVQLDKDEAYVERIRVAANLHDIGKISVPAEILSKPGALTPIEYELVKTHPESAAAILRSVDVGWPLADIVEQHHERVDGSGYPNGLLGEATLLEARILAVADVVEAMASHRPYRPSAGLDAALAEITQQRGSLYDPEVVDACLSVIAAGFEFEQP